MTAIYILVIITAIVSFCLGRVIYKLIKPDGTLTVDATDPDDVRMDFTGINVLDGNQRYYILRVSRYKTNCK